MWHNARDTQPNNQRFVKVRLSTGEVAEGKYIDGVWFATTMYLPFTNPDAFGIEVLEWQELDSIH